MKPEVHEEIYRVAYDAASSELTDISLEFERLRSRKEQVEKLITVLKPLIPELDQNAAGDSSAVPSTEQPQASTETQSQEQSPQSESFSSDPFQRRIDHVLGIGAGIRDVRKYSRQF